MSYYYLNDSVNYVKKHPGGRPKATTFRERRAVLKHASNSALTARQIAVEAGAKVSVRTVQRIMQSSKNFKRRKMVKKHDHI